MTHFWPHAVAVQYKFKHLFNSVGGCCDVMLVMRPQKVKVVTTKYVRLCIFMAMKDGWIIIIDHQQVCGLVV